MVEIKKIVVVVARRRLVVPEVILEVLPRGCSPEEHLSSNP